MEILISDCKFDGIIRKRWYEWEEFVDEEDKSFKASI